MDIVSWILVAIGCYVVFVFFSKISFSLRKSWFITNLTKKYEQMTDISNFSVEKLLDGSPSAHEYVSNELYNYCVEHSPFKEIVVHHRVTLSDFHSIFLTLSVTSCVYSKGLFVPIAAFLFPQSLDYILNIRPDKADASESKKIAMNLINFFDNA